MPKAAALKKRKAATPEPKVTEVEEEKLLQHLLLPK
jgi:hypothetical protein